jgi:hypothetical protein
MEFMKPLRMLVLALAVSVFPIFLIQAHGQQEIDPDHFDQPPAAKANVPTLKARTNHRASAAVHQTPKHATTARKHSGRKPNHDDQGQTSQSSFLVGVLPSAAS